MKRVFGFSAGLLVSLLSITSLSLAQASPNSGDISLFYNGDSGTIFVSHKFTKKVRANCRVIVRGGIHYEGDTVATAERQLIKQKITRKTKKLEYVVQDLDGATNNPDGLFPILTLQSKVRCPGFNEFVTSAAARFVNCGISGQDVPPDEFLSDLKKGLRTGLITVLPTE